MRLCMTWALPQRMWYVDVERWVTPDGGLCELEISDIFCRVQNALLGRGWSSKKITKSETWLRLSVIKWCRIKAMTRKDDELVQTKTIAPGLNRKLFWEVKWCSVCMYCKKKLCFPPWQLTMIELSMRVCCDFGVSLTHGWKLPEPKDKTGFSSGHLLLKSTFVVCRECLGKKKHARNPPSTILQYNIDNKTFVLNTDGNRYALAMLKASWPAILLSQMKNLTV